MEWGDGELGVGGRSDSHAQRIPPVCALLGSELPAATFEPETVGPTYQNDRSYQRRLHVSHAPSKSLKGETAGWALKI